jgi:hypothetical protein
MNIVDRVQSIILKPKETWEKIAGESDTVGGLFTSYIIPLAAIGPIAGFIGTALIGTTIGGFTYKTPVASGLVSAVVGYVLALAATYVTGVVIASELAPSFGGQKSQIDGLKLIAYASTPAWVFSILGILPALGIIVLLAALYGLYVLYLGVPPVMKVPPDKQVVYTLILVVISVVLFLVIGAVVAALRAAAGGAVGL